MSNLLESAVAAMRAEGTSTHDGDLAEATRERLVRSLEVRARHHRQLMAIVTVLVVLLGGTVSWALSTGAIQRWFGAPATQKDTPIEVPAPPAPARATGVPNTWPSAPAELPAPSPVHEQAPAKDDAKDDAKGDARPPTSPVVIPPAPAPRPLPPPAPRPALAAAEIEVLYRRAHELHFRGSDRGAALAAWDAYLTAEPSGRFSVEARFNRALVLVRLGRYAEALAALEPYARGEIDAGYRREEAAALVDRLRPLVAGEGSAMARSNP